MVKAVRFYELGGPEVLKVENVEVGDPGPGEARVRERLEHLDTQTENIGLPLSFTNELYDLRAHIELVRQRLRGRMAPGP